MQLLPWMSSALCKPSVQTVKVKVVYSLGVAIAKYISENYCFDLFYCHCVRSVEIFNRNLQ